MTIRPDYTNTSDRDLTITDGLYPVYVKNAEVKQGPLGPYIECKLKIVDHPILTNRSKKGLEFWHRLPLTGEWSYITKQFVMAADPLLNPLEFELTDLIGKKVEVFVKNKPSKKDPAKMFPIVQSVKGLVDTDAGTDTGMFSAFADTENTEHA